MSCNRDCLPAGWRRRPDQALLDLEVCDECEDEILAEIDQRDDQRDADRGAINGVAPSR